ncbi:MAG: pyruvate kinase [Endomicrobium sp.]|uniref:pyruvate kinase n=1 Tax=Candidatus Endomicrobiellum cubanum TaxID=3242325 RepID=UPI0028178AD4|nr:pyruvate kinase [Endomicrobium sp.]
MAKTGIICTMGPAIRSIETLKALTENGMTIIRLNFSHGSLQEHESDIELVRAVNKNYGKNIKILADLEGHRIRVGKIENGQVELKKEQKITLTRKDILGNNKIIHIDYPNSFKAIKEGLTIFIEDGNLTLKVLSSTENEVVTQVQMDYLLKTSKGVNIPYAELEFELLEEKDKKGFMFALEKNLDFVANSFVRDAQDMQPLVDILKEQNNTKCKLVAKIEDMSGIENIEQIMTKTSGIMVARGDMGVSIPIYKVPIMQKRIIRKCKEHNNFVITATQMLDSMIKNPVPTRAEVCDIANAVIDGTDYTMLSGETSVGKFPQKAVEMMYNVIKFTEENLGTLQQ